MVVFYRTQQHRRRSHDRFPFAVPPTPDLTQPQTASVFPPHATRGPAARHAARGPAAPASRHVKHHVATDYFSAIQCFGFFHGVGSKIDASSATSVLMSL